MSDLESRSSASTDHPDAVSPASSPGKRTLTEDAYARGGGQATPVGGQASPGGASVQMRGSSESSYRADLGYDLSGAGTYPVVQRRASTSPVVQLHAKEGAAPQAAASQEAAPQAEGAARQPETLIVADSVEAQTGQLTKTAFLAQLRAAVTDMTSLLAGPEWSVASCPDIPRIFDHYASLDARDVERIMRRYSRQAGAASAAELIAPICARLAGAITRWSDGEEMSWDLGASGLPLAVEGGAGPAPAAPATPAAPAEPAPEQPVNATSVRLKSSGAGASSEVNPATDLGAGTAIDGSTAARMGAAFGESFSDVRIHTESVAANKTRELGADAMAMGNHVAFAPGEYQPGTPAGDGLIAHELAHVIQQRGTEPVVQRRSISVDTSSTHERDADDAADAVVARLHGGETGSAPIRPALSAGLGVQRGNSPKKAEAKPVPRPRVAIPAPVVEDPAVVLARQQREAARLAAAANERALLTLRDDAGQPTAKLGNEIKRLADLRGWFDPADYYDPNARSKLSRLRADQAPWRGLAFGHTAADENWDVIGAVAASAPFLAFLATEGVTTPDDAQLQNAIRRAVSGLSSGGVTYVGSDRGGGHGESHF